MTDITPIVLDHLDANAKELFLREVEAGLAEHTVEKCAPALVFEPLCIAQRDETGKLIGGLSGKSFWDWLNIDSLWVLKGERGKGIGKALVRAAEKEACARGCVGIYLWTQSFDAPWFYPKLGYKEFVVMQDFPVGHQRIGFMKRLVS